MPGVTPCRGTVPLAKGTLQVNWVYAWSGMMSRHAPDTLPAAALAICKSMACVQVIEGVIRASTLVRHEEPTRKARFCGVQKSTGKYHVVSSVAVPVVAVRL